MYDIDTVINLLPRHHIHHHRRRKHRRRLALVLVACLPLVYLVASTVVFFAVKYHWTDVSGEADPLTNEFDTFATEQPEAPIVLPLNTNTPPPTKLVTPDTALLKRQSTASCRIDVLGRQWPTNAAPIAQAKKQGVSITTIERMLFAVKLRVPSSSHLHQSWQDCAEDRPVDLPSFQPTTTDLFPWKNSRQWETISTALRKDADLIGRVSKETNVPERLIVSTAIVEQFRLYFSQRELFEKVFEPLKILGNSTQFAWGVMAIKEATAIDIENHLKDSGSPWYLGSSDAHLLDYKAGEDVAKTRFSRLTNERDHYWSYMYGALELKQFMLQWARAKHNIDDRPEILATLFNIGFGRSRPSAKPQVGGSTLTIAETKYSFGALAYEWYYSGLLTDIFPYNQ